MGALWYWKKGKILVLAGALSLFFLIFFADWLATSSPGRFSLAKRLKDEVGLADCSDPSLEEETFN